MDAYGLSLQLRSIIELALVMADSLSCSRATSIFTTFQLGTTEEQQAVRLVPPSLLIAVHCSDKQCSVDIPLSMFWTSLQVACSCWAAVLSHLIVGFQRSLASHPSQFKP